MRTCTRTCRHVGTHAITLSLYPLGRLPICPHTPTPAHTPLQVVFYAKSSASSFPLGLNSRKDEPDWENYGLDKKVFLSTSWSEYQATFVATATTADCRVSFYLGSAIGIVWIDNVTLATAAPEPPPVYLRTFANGAVILNGDRTAHNITVGAGYRRLVGQQAPMHQFIVDDYSTAFANTSGDWALAQYASGYNFSHPSMEEDNGPYYHHWAKGCHQAVGAATATFHLGILEAGSYNVSAWWAAATPADMSWSTGVTFQVPPLRFVYYHYSV